MKCEHGRSLGIYCRECGRVKDRDSAPLQSGVMCLDCLKADILLRMALTAARGRLLDVTNTEHDKAFEKIAEYLDKKYPYKLGCPSLD